jgi:hypothetical protein
MSENQNTNNSTNQENNGLYSFFSKPKNLLWAFGIIIVGLPLILTNSFFYIVNFKDTGPIGDTIGGITSPFISAVVGILTYLAFKEQIRANEINIVNFQKQLKDQQEANKKNFEYIEAQIDKQDEANQLTQKASERQQFFQNLVFFSELLSKKVDDLKKTSQYANFEFCNEEIIRIFSTIQESEPNSDISFLDFYTLAFEQDSLKDTISSNIKQHVKIQIKLANQILHTTSLVDLETIIKFYQLIFSNLSRAINTDLITDNEDDSLRALLVLTIGKNTLAVHHLISIEQHKMKQFDSYQKTIAKPLQMRPGMLNYLRKNHPKLIS